DFIAPEQVTDPGRADPCSDLYGLGGTLYFLLTGQVPFPGGEGVEKAKRHLTGTPQPVEELRPGLPEGLGELVRRLMARNKAERVSSAAEAAAELSRFAAPITVPVWEAAATTVSIPTTADISTMSEPI
ncbi:MAG TPA: hypothetical protein VMZ71_15540, partial [Gemmataceae bacterium]|nr:hypothetical protein [Gemmataceae bacterium]